MKDRDRLKELIQELREAETRVKKLVAEQLTVPLRERNKDKCKNRIHAWAKEPEGSLANGTRDKKFTEDDLLRLAKNRWLEMAKDAETRQWINSCFMTRSYADASK